MIEVSSPAPLLCKGHHDRINEFLYIFCVLGEPLAPGTDQLTRNVHGAQLERIFPVVAEQLDETF